MKPAFAYRRVSTGRQAANGVSLESQDASADTWAAQHDHVIVDRFADPGVSGKRADNRPGLQAAIQAVCESKGTLVVYSISRLARSVPELYAISKRIEKARGNLVSLTEPIDTTTPFGKAFFGFLAVLAQLGSDLTSTMTRDVLHFKRDHGLKYGEVPYGYRVVLNPSCPKHTVDSAKACSCALVRDDAEMRTIQRVRGWRSDGLSWNVIAGKLNDRQILTKKGKLWTGQNARVTLSA